jgi:hypothetical protein
MFSGSYAQHAAQGSLHVFPVGGFLGLGHSHQLPCAGHQQHEAGYGVYLVAEQLQEADRQRGQWGWRRRHDGEAPW